jgi:hypothetical protein
VSGYLASAAVLGIRITFKFEKTGGFLKILFMSFIQHCFICRPSDMSEDAGIEPKTVTTSVADP